MAERHSPLAAVRHPGESNGTLRLTRLTPGAVIQVTAWPDTDAAVRGRIAEVTGLAMPAMGFAAHGPDAVALYPAPGRTLVACPAQMAARLHRVLAGADAAFTDLGHGRVILRLEGRHAVDVLAKGAALDFDLEVFPPGRIAATVIHHVDVTIYRREPQAFDLWVLRGFAQELTEWLLDAGLEFSIGLEPR